MDTFTYGNLKRAWETNGRIGHWQGKPVYAISKKDLVDSCVNGVYYVVFDDDNSIVGLNREYRLMKYGSVNVKGEVDEFPYAATYIKEKPQPQREPEAVASGAAEVVGDVRLGELVAQTLKAARDMTVNSLLEGFEYGLA